MGTEKYPKVAIIVLNYKGWQDTIECLESLQQIDYPDYQIVGYISTVEICISGTEIDLIPGPTIIIGTLTTASL